MRLDELLRSIDGGLKELREGGDLRNRRGGSRFAGEGADDEVIAELAAGGDDRLRTSEPPHRTGRKASKTPIVDAARRAYHHAAFTDYERKAMAEGTPSAGGYLVETEYADEVLRLLRSRTVVIRAGATVRPVRKELDLNSISTGTSADWVAENALIPMSEMTLGQAPLLRPRDLVAMTAASLRLIRDTEGDAESAEEIVRRDMTEQMALKADDGFLQGDGVAPRPLGLKQVAIADGLTPWDTGADGIEISAADPAAVWAGLVSVVSAPRAQNAPYRKPAWFVNGRTIESLQKIVDADKRPLFFDGELLTVDAADGTTGTLLGFPWYASNQIPTNLVKGASGATCSYLLFTSDADEVWIGENPDIEVDVSGEASYSTDGGTSWTSAYQARQLLLRGIARYDIGVRRPNLLVYADGLRP